MVCALYLLMLLQAVQHRIHLQKQHALFTSNQKRGSVHKLLNAVMKKLQQDKPKADMLIIMAVGDMTKLMQQMW